MVSWAFYDLEQKLTYKVAENNCAVIKVPPQYTSQCCPMCDHIERGNRDIEDAVIIIPTLADVVADNDLRERITSQCEWLVLGNCLFLCSQSVGRLNVGLFAARDRNKVDFSCNRRDLSLAFFSLP